MDRFRGTANYANIRKCMGYGQSILTFVTSIFSLFQVYMIRFIWSVFYISDELCLFKDINGFFSAIGIDHNHEEWRLFIDSSTNSLKAVLLHNENQFSSLPRYE